MPKKKYSYNALVAMLFITLALTLSSVVPVGAANSDGNVTLAATVRPTKSQSKAAKRQYRNDLKSAKADYRAAVKSANSNYNSILKSTTDKNIRKQAKAAHEKAIADAQTKFYQAKKDALAVQNQS